MTLDTIATSGGNAYLAGNGETLTNTNNTIQGTGIIGNGSCVINGGVIDDYPRGRDQHAVAERLGRLYQHRHAGGDRWRHLGAQLPGGEQR